jgi:integrase
VAALTDPPKTRAHEIEPYTPAQARKFLQALKGDRLEALFTVAVSLGLRQGEIIGLRWEDVDLKNRKIHVRCQLQRVDGKPTFLPLKTKKSRRILTIPALAIPILYAHQLRQQEEQSLAGDRWREYGLVFTTKLAHL